MVKLGNFEKRLEIREVREGARLEETDLVTKYQKRAVESKYKIVFMITIL